MIKHKSFTLYIAGPMSGVDGFNFPAFHQAASDLRTAGYNIVSPAEAVHNGDLTKSWDYYLREDIKLLMDCDGVALLPGWEKSRGANTERTLAIMLDMPVSLVATWINSAEKLL